MPRSVIDPWAAVAELKADLARNYVARYLRGEYALVDTHLHITRESLIQYPDDFRAFLATCGAKMGRDEKSEGVGDFSEADFHAAVESGGGGVRVESAVFVEVLPVEPSAIAEARWVLDMASSSKSVVESVVVHIPVMLGEAAVHQWMADLAASLGEDRFAEARRRIRGCRQVLASEPLGVFGSGALLDGLGALAKLQLGSEPAPLHFEFCVKASQLEGVLHAVRSTPATRFVLDHCGLNDSGQDFEAWKRHMSALAGCDNVVGCKLSAIEEWDCVDGEPAPYLDHALSCFGTKRCMYGGNWFVPLNFDKPYSETARLVGLALQRMCASAEQVADVFENTARRVYGLDGGGDE